MTFQDRANEFALRVLKDAQPTVARNMARYGLFTQFSIAGTPEQVKGVLDFVGLQVKGRRVSDVSLILPKILITRVSNGYDLLGSTCVGAVLFGGYEDSSILKVCGLAAKTARSWGLGEVLIESKENS